MKYNIYVLAFKILRDLEDFHITVYYMLKVAEVKRNIIYVMVSMKERRSY
jgi:hypothetical protein